MKFETQNRGQAALIAVVLMLIIMLSAVFGASAVALTESRAANKSTNSRFSFFAAEAGVDDAVYRLKRGKNLTSSFTITLNGATAPTIITTNGGVKEVKSVGAYSGATRAARATLSSASGGSFHYGIQIGNGGLQMENNSRVNGSVYSNGDIVGNNNPNITGDAFLAGASTISGVTVGRNIQIGQPSLPMPISNALLDQWEGEAAAGGSATCSGGVYRPANGDSIGPKKVPCDMEISGTDIVTLTGALWVAGDFTIQNSAQLKLASNDQFSRVVIADNPASRTTSSRVKVQNSAQILGSSVPDTYVLMASRNSSAEGGGDEEAIEVSNSSAAPIYYAPHGSVEIQNNVSLKEVTAYKILLKNSAEITYETGLANINFSSGPTGGWNITSWGEVVP
ncbi:MAG: hypothetical protein A3B03_02675 [Candidatus Zambryskibacteria bacterium RIFCSPLOWO2_01_FULL_42_41]|nr:MAG: hypothetical protein A3B03_02675 [Candidatus Zambryskibacteria bacterium RIFCSPLOWO2_01_FULL_42_41]